MPSRFCPPTADRPLATRRRWEGFSDPEELGREIKKLGKKIRQIEDLEAKAAGGTELDPAQQDKITGKAGLEEEQKKLLALQATL